LPGAAEKTSRFLQDTSLVSCEEEQPMSLRDELNRRSLDELRIIAGKLKIKGRRKLANQQKLVAAILACDEAQVRQAARITWWNRYHNHFYGTAGVTALILGVVFYLYPLPQAPKAPPELQLAWYQQTPSGLRLLDPADVTVEVGVDEMLANRIKVPINLAVSNRDNEPLRVVRVELSYPRDIEVVSEGKARIDPAGRVLIYEHDIGTLENIAHFTPLERVDTISIPFKFVPVPTIAISADGVPIYTVVIAAFDGIFADKKVTLRARVLCEDRRPAVGTIDVLLKAGIQMVLDFGEGKTVDATARDKELFASPLPNGWQIQAAWNAALPDGREIDYKKAKKDQSVVQFIEVQRVRRKIMVDGDGDGNLDFAIIDTTGDGIADKKFISTSRHPMMDWPKEGIPKNATAPAK
jgi:hypothetical protein